MKTLVSAVILALGCYQSIDGLGDSLNRDLAISFLSNQNGWMIRESTSLAVNPVMTITPTSRQVGPNQRIVIVDLGNDTYPSLATIGASLTNHNNRHSQFSRKKVDYDSLIVTPIPLEGEEESNNTEIATPVTFTFLPTGGHTNECMVSKMTIGSNTVVNNVMVNLNPTGRADCMIWVQRNDTDIDSKELLKCRYVMKTKCQRLARNVKLVALPTNEKPDDSQQ